MAFHTLKWTQSPSYLADGAAWQSPDFIFELRMVENKVSRLYGRPAGFAAGKKEGDGPIYLRQIKQTIGYSVTSRTMLTSS